MIVWIVYLIALALIVAGLLGVLVFSLGGLYVVVGIVGVIILFYAILRARKDKRETTT